jgi:hypothetical protein
VDDAFTFPVMPTSSATFTMGSNFSSPSAGTQGLSYAFDYNNVRFVMLDQFITFDGTASASGNYKLDPQLPWIASTLAGKPAGGHALVFGHKGLITENHVDTLFGANPSVDPTGQDTFINALASNGVRYYMGGHDHMHNRSLVTTTDGVTAKVMDIIGASDSSKFYIPAIPSNDQKYDVPAFRPHPPDPDRARAQHRGLLHLHRERLGCVGRLLLGRGQSDTVERRVPDQRLNPHDLHQA